MTNHVHVLIELVRRCAARRPLLVCTDGLVSSIRAMRRPLAILCIRARVDDHGCVGGAMS
jgi:hypothetical protein